MRKPKLYKVDLDEPPEERWAEVIEDHKQHLPQIKKLMRNYYSTPVRTTMCWLLEKMALNFPEEYVKEMEGIAKLTGLDYCEVVGINSFYEITNFNTVIEDALVAERSMSGCTSIVAEDEGGRIIHGRNLDYFRPDLLKDLTIMVDFMRNDKIQYSGLTFAFYAGLLTGQRPYAFTLSLNGRRSGWFVYNILMQIYTTFRTSTAFELRQVLETAKTYDDALKEITGMHFISPCYIVLGGTKSGEGALVTRDRLKTVDVLTLNVKKDRWFIVQSNFDHWDPDEDNRRTTAEIFLKEIKHENLDEDTMWAVLKQTPTRHKLTISRTVMSAHTPAMFYRNTVISD